MLALYGLPLIFIAFNCLLFANLFYNIFYGGFMVCINIVQSLGTFVYLLIGIYYSPLSLPPTFFYNVGWYSWIHLEWNIFRPTAGGGSHLD